MGDERGTRVYVGNLTDKVKKEQLEEEFTRFGKLNSVWIAHNPPGFAFIEFANKDEAESACDSLNGQELLGSKLRVEISKGRSRGPRGGGRGGGGRFSDRRGSGGGGFRREGGGRFNDRNSGGGGFRGGRGSGGFRSGGDRYGGSSSGPRSYERRDNFGSGGGGGSGYRSSGSGRSYDRSRSPQGGRRF
ncbi:CLUMA_CG007848, isoform A [Clunio marinus]|uniref:CLUMA_CG007848, isoform A n=1 Tax=Clunio marinus TaxID=568069 RepID=A0A1J1I217_9DIPT|nr:CLUMA_CG007848, isoform A [Clunio marinus]